MFPCQKLHVSSEAGPEPVCLQELRRMVGHLQAWGIPLEAIAVDPLLAPHADYYSGVIFQVHVTPASP
eukprot:scaffold125104_cov25-Prasinocladus_malaysianus.AAC.1